MSDQDILLRLLQKAYTDDALTQQEKKEYEKLVVRFDEYGAEQEFPLATLEEHRESSLCNLATQGYTTQSLRYHGPGGGYVLHVNLRGEEYLALANQHAAGPQIELPLGCDHPLPLVAGLTEQNHGDCKSSSLMQDSGQRQTFATGAVRDTADGKPRPDLVSPFAVDRLGEWLRLGSLKYAERNWERGIPISRSFASMYRHLLKFQQGATDEDHIAAILCNAMFIAHTQEMCKLGVLPESLLDMPKYRPLPGVHQNGDEILDHEPDDDPKM